jgi:hypothetical protein
VSRRFSIQNLRAAWWADRALRRARRELSQTGLRGFVLLPPPRLPASAERGVQAVLRRRNGTCLERALILQGWRRAHGDAREIVIGVRNLSSTFQAHAWLDGDPDEQAASFEELLRVPAGGALWIPTG